MRIRKTVYVNREISFTVDEILEHLDEDFKEILRTALFSRDLRGITCYSKFSNKIDFSLFHEEDLKELENV